jgi:hypothetical protein
MKLAVESSSEPDTEPISKSGGSHPQLRSRLHREVGRVCVSVPNGVTPNGIVPNGVMPSGPAGYRS